MTRWITAVALVLATFTQAAAEPRPIKEARLVDRLKDLGRAPVTRVDLDCGDNQKDCMDGAKARGPGWSCRYVREWQQWCLFPPGS